MTQPKVWIVLPLLMAGSGCVTAHSCARAGNTSWDWDEEYRESRRVASCDIKNLGEGKRVIDGDYVEYYDDGKVALEGAFRSGHKEGLWTQYDPQGKTVKELFFRDGVQLDPKDGKPITGKLSPFGGE